MQSQFNFPISILSVGILAIAFALVLQGHAIAQPIPPATCKKSNVKVRTFNTYYKVPGTTLKAIQQYLAYSSKPNAPQIGNKTAFTTYQFAHKVVRDFAGATPPAPPNAVGPVNFVVKRACVSLEIERILPKFTDPKWPHVGLRGQNPLRLTRLRM